MHFILAEDAVAHDHLICLNTGRDLDDPNRMRYTFQGISKSPEEMAALLPDHPEALATTLEIADKCEDYKLTHAPLMPNFPPPEDFPIALGELRESFVKKIDDEGCWRRSAPAPPFRSWRSWLPATRSFRTG